MDRALPRVIVAGLAPVMRDVCAALASRAVVIPAQTFKEAEQRLRDDPPDALLVAYHFDELQPFRLIRLVREHRDRKHLPILLVRVLQVDMGATQEEVRQAYQSFGANDFFDLQTLAQRYGQQAALDKLCERMRTLVRRPLLAVK